jgi:hypothetical protein
MFEMDKLMRILSILMGLGSLIAAISGFVDIANEFVLSNIFLSIHALIMFFLINFYEFKIFPEIDESNNYYNRSIVHTYSGFLILGVSKISLGIGIFSIVLGLINLFIYLNKNTNPPILENT